MTSFQKQVRVNAEGRERPTYNQLTSREARRLSNCRRLHVMLIVDLSTDVSTIDSDLITVNTTEYKFHTF